MTNKAVKLTGVQVKDLLTKAVDGIYLSRKFEVMTDFYNKFSITNDGLEITVNDMLTAKIPIQDDAEYINFAVGCDLSESENEDIIYEEWESSTYFGYKFEIANIMISFNVTTVNDCNLTWEQFRELVTNEKYISFEVQNVDGGLYIDMNHANIYFLNVDDTYFNICSPYADIEIDKEIVAAIYNDTTTLKKVYYRIEFNNGMSDLAIEIEEDSKIFPN